MARIYSTVQNNADLKALESASGAVDLEGAPTAAADIAAAQVTIFDALLAAGETTANAARVANPNSTEKLVTYNAVFTGTATHAEIAAALKTYTNALAVAADVVVVTATAAVDALTNVTSTDVLELTLDGDPTGETSDLTIAAGELAYATDAEVTCVQTLYCDVNIDGTILEAACETIITDYVEALDAGAVIDQSALEALILDDAGVTAVNTCNISFAATPTEAEDLTLAVGCTGTATAASITFTDAD